MRIETRNTYTYQMHNNAPSNKTRLSNVDGATISVGRSNNLQTDTFNKGNNVNFSASEEQRYENIYKKIANICNDHDINIELAMSFGLLEKIAGVMTKAELIQLDDNTINELVQILDSSLGWGDGLGFGEKDINDLTKLTTNIHKKIAFEKTGGSKLGQIWHNFKNGIKSFFGGKTAENCQNENELSSYYQEKYLKDIQSATNDEKVDIYQKLLKEFYYDFNSLNNNEKRLQMVKAIENLAANDRATMVKVIENSFIQDPQALALFGKILDTNFETIILNRDGFNNTVNKLEATAISHTAYRHMSEEDINNSLLHNKERALLFNNKNRAKIDELRKKQANGETLTLEEEDLLLKAECFETKYAGALTGTSVNYNLTDNSRIDFLNRISNDTDEIGIQKAVFQAASEFVDKTTDTYVMPKQKFTTLMDSVTNGCYSKVVNSPSKMKTSANYSSNVAKNNIENNQATNLSSSRKSNNLNYINVNQEKNKETNQETNSLTINNNEEMKTKEKIEKAEKRDLKSVKKKSQNSITTSQNIQNSQNIENVKVNQQEVVNDKENTPQKLTTVIQKGVKAIKEFKEEQNINNYDLTIEILNTTNTSSQVRDWALENFETWNETQKANNCSRITNNANKIAAGKLIKQISTLKRVDCNNFYVKSEFEKLIQKQEEKNPSSNTHLSTQKSFC